MVISDDGKMEGRKADSVWSGVILKGAAIILWRERFHREKTRQQKRRSAFDYFIVLSSVDIAANSI